MTVRDTGVVFAALWRHLVLRRPVAGAFRAVGFSREGHDARSVARRAVAKAAGSVAANTHVVGIDDQDDVILVHQLVPSDDLAGDADPVELR